MPDPPLCIRTICKGSMLGQHWAKHSGAIQLLTLFTASTDSVVLALLEIETTFNFAFTTIVTDAGKNLLSQN